MRAEITPSVLPLRGNPPSPRGRLLVVAVMFLTEVQSAPERRSPLPSSPTAMPPSPRGRLLVVAIKFAAMLKGVPLGELAANAVSRLRGSFEGSSSPLFHMEQFTSLRRR